MPRASCRIVVQSSGKKVDPHLGFLVSPRGQCFSSGGQAEGCVVVLELPNWRACGPGVKDRRRRTQATLGFWARAWQVRSAELNRDLVHLKSGEDLMNAQVGVSVPYGPLHEEVVDHEAMEFFPRWEL